MTKPALWEDGLLLGENDISFRTTLHGVTLSLRSSITRWGVRLQPSDSTAGIALKVLIVRQKGEVRLRSDGSLLRPRNRTTEQVSGLALTICHVDDKNGPPGQLRWAFTSQNDEHLSDCIGGAGPSKMDDVISSGLVPSSSAGAHVKTQRTVNTHLGCHLHELSRVSKSPPADPADCRYGD